MLIGAPAQAHLQDCQIVRLLSYQSTCRLETLERRPATPTKSLDNLHLLDRH